MLLSASVSQNTVRAPFCDVWPVCVVLLHMCLLSYASSSVPEVLVAISPSIRSMSLAGLDFGADDFSADADDNDEKQGLDDRGLPWEARWEGPQISLPNGGHIFYRSYKFNFSSALFSKKIGQARQETFVLEPFAACRTTARPCQAPCSSLFVIAP